ncbi:MAG: sugar transferase [Bacteroidales bacterium]|nr:sugar transferase [Bacteroidales bacterium]
MKFSIFKLLLFNFLLLIILSALSFKMFQGYKLITPQNLKIVTLLCFLWLLFSFLFRKYKVRSGGRFGRVFNRIVFSNILAFTVFYILLFSLRIVRPSWKVLVTVFFLATFAEVVYAYFYFWLKFAITEPETEIRTKRKAEFPQQSKQVQLTNLLTKKQIEYREFTLLHEIGKEAYQFIFYYAALDTANTLILNTSSDFNIHTQLAPKFDCIINIRKTNDIRRINKFFEAANEKLPDGGLYIGLVETKDERKKRLLKKYPPVINYIFYSIDFIFKRIAPKFIITKKFYFLITRGFNRILSKAETFGRLYSCGFEVLDEKEVNNYLYFVAIKTKKPFYPSNPSYGPFIALERVGKGGKTIKVYKLRTMHPYAEYLQDYIYKKHGLQNGGKFKDDFRISTLGKIFRKFWIDELPMLLNLFKGDLKLVGVRPISKQYFSLYSDELKKRRIKYKPGLIPPFYVDMPETFEEIMESELKYLTLYEKHPLLTDIRYLFISLFNIIIKRKRSK